MKAMILAAGRGTRLRPLTDDVPKILVPVLGVPMLDRLRAFLGRCGVSPLAINTHHKAHTVRAHLRGAAEAGLPPARLFHEPALLGTGGALVNAAQFWGDEPLLVWNGDILAELEPAALLRAQQASGSLATLVVQERTSDSRLLIDAEGALCGIDSRRRGTQRRVTAPRKPVSALAFNGISLLAPNLRALLPAGGAFDLIDALLDAIARGGRVSCFDMGAGFFGTTGSVERLRQLEQGLSAHRTLLARWSP